MGRRQSSDNKKTAVAEHRDDGDYIFIKNVPLALKIDRLIGRFGIYLKKKNPKLYLFLKKNIKINLRKEQERR